MAKELSAVQCIERSINKKYRKSIWNPFIEGIKKYCLVESGDKIAVCISGGKDSMLLAKLMQLLNRYSEVPFSLEFLVMDPGYSPKNRQKIEENAKLLEIPVKIFETEIFDIANSVPKSPCYLCARMRRGYLYSEARKLGCNKIALGHHMDDVIETTVMGMFYGAQIQAMPPKLLSTNFEGMELIRPLYCVREDSIISWKNYNNLSFLQCACRFTENVSAAGDGVGESKRQEIKQLIKSLKKTNPNIEKSIFRSLHSVCLDTLLGVKTGKREYDFNELFAERKQRAKAARNADATAKTDELQNCDCKKTTSFENDV